MTQKKLEAKERIAQALGAALRLACKHGYSRLTRDAIALEAGMPPTLISYHLGTMPNVQRAIMREAVRTRCLPVIAQGLAVRDRHALKAAPELRQSALASLAH